MTDLLLGFSTGVFKDETLSVYDRLREFAKVACSIIELGFVQIHRFEKFDPEERPQEFVDLLAQYKYVSLHAPKCTYDKTAETAKVFEKINKVHKLRQLDLVIFHPDTIVDFELFNNLPFPVAFENMDKRKTFGRTVEDIQNVLAKNPTFKMVLDVNHVFTNDPTMKLAEDFLASLGDRIAEIHLSGYTKLHDPIYISKQDFIAKPIINLEKPIIVESDLDPSEVELEKNYIRSLLRN